MSSQKQLNPKEELNKFQYFFYDYGRYHNNTVNKIIHIIFVPLISATLLYLLRSFSSFLTGRDFEDLSFSTFFIISISFLYVYVDFTIGTVTSIQYLIVDYLMSKFKLDIEGISDLKIILIIHIMSWVFQFIGHGAFEGRKPALVDNILLTLNAPVFVNAEIFYYLFGWRKKQIEDITPYILEDISNSGKKSKVG
jgi:uncharacterized membrane protein YGL010W